MYVCIRSHVFRYVVCKCVSSTVCLCMAIRKDVKEAKIHKEKGSKMHVRFYHIQWQVTKRRKKYCILPWAIWTKSIDISFRKFHHFFFSLAAAFPLNEDQRMETLCLKICFSLSSYSQIYKMSNRPISFFISLFMKKKNMFRLLRSNVIQSS